MSNRFKIIPVPDFDGARAFCVVDTTTWESVTGDMTYRDAERLCKELNDLEKNGVRV